MLSRSNWIVLAACALGSALMVVGSGCRDTYTGSSGRDDGDGGGGEGGVGGVGPAGSTSSGEGGSMMTSTSSGSPAGSTGSGSGTGGGAPACDGQEVTIFDVTGDPSAANPVGPKTPVKVKNVVVMSQKFLVSKSNTTGSCLWGVFVSAPGLAETAPYSGTMVLSYGTKATQDPDSGNFFCPKLGVDPAGDAIPDDVVPGDVLNVVGKTDYFLLNQCATEQDGSSVPQRQISQSCLVEKTGNKATVPAAHKLTAAEVAELASPSNKAFHDKWGGVKVKIEGSFPAEPQTVAGKPSAVSQYGEIILQDSGLGIGDKIYYRGYLAKSQACHAGPVLTLPYTLQRAEGFNYLNFCTWNMQTNNKCTDIAPASEDCAAGGPNGMPLMCP